MHKIAAPASNVNDPDYVLAQTLAAEAEWLMDGGGGIYDSEGVILAPNLVILGRIMRSLEWFAEVESHDPSGVARRRVPAEAHLRDAAVRGMARELGL